MNKRMAAIIKMLSSTSDGEVVNAARMLGRMLKENGKDWNDLGEYLSRWNPLAQVDKTYKVQEASAPPRHTTTNAVRPGWERRATETPVDHDLVKEQISALNDLLAQGSFRFSRKDINFIEGLAEAFDLYGARTLISSAQASWAQNLYKYHIENKGKQRR